MNRRALKSWLLPLALLLLALLDRFVPLSRGPLLRAEPFSLTALLVSLAFSAASYAVNRIFGPKPPTVTRGKMEGELLLQNAQEGVGIAEIYGGAGSAATAKVTWKTSTLTNATVQADGDLEKTAGADNCGTNASGTGDAGARSNESITGGDWEVSWTFGPSPTSGRSFLGLRNGFSLDYTTYKYCIHVSTSLNTTETPNLQDAIFIYENGPPRKAYLNHAWAAGDTLRIRCVSGVVTYWHKDTLIYTSSQSPTYPLNVNVSMACSNSTAERVQITTAGASTQSGIRTAGTIIWAKPPRKVVTKEKKGGKGAPKQTVETITYYTDLAILFGRGRLGLKKLQANADTILDLEAGIGAATGLVDGGATNTTTYTQGNGIIPGPSTSAPTTYFAARIEEDANGVLSGSLGAAGGTAMRFYEGNWDQLPDALIQADIDAKYGAGSTPAYRGYCYLVVENFNISKYGGIPTFIATLYNKDIGDTRALSEHLAERSGVLPGDRDFSNLFETLRGLIVTDPQPARQTLETALTPFSSIYYESIEGQLTAQALGASPAVMLDPAWFGMADGDGASAAGEMPPEFELRLVDEVQLPRQLTVTAYDPSKGHEQTAQHAFLQSADAEGVESLALPMTLLPDEARQAAERLLYQRWVGKESGTIRLPWRYAWLNPTDVVSITRNGIEHKMRIAQIAGAIPGLQEWSLIADESAVYSQTVAGDSGGGYEPPTVSVPVESIALLIDTVTLRDQDDAAGYYAAVVPRSEAAGWGGAVLYRDRGAGYEIVERILTPATAGTLVSSVTSVESNNLDAVTTITVDLYGTSATLESITDDQLHNGANAAVIGDGMIIQFKTAVKVGGYNNRWTLSNLLWSRRGSDFAVATHPAGARFVLLDGAVLFIENDLTERNQARDFKAVTAGYAIDDTAATSFTWRCRTLMPLSPVDVQGSRDGSNNLTITWKRRTRIGGAWIDGTDAPLGEASESYEIDIMSGSTVLRTITATSPTATYSAANQTTDGLTPGNPVTVNLYQISARVGRGFGRAATI